MKQQCCGVSSYSDWQYSKWVMKQNYMLTKSNTLSSNSVNSPNDDSNFVHAPDSCCKTIDDTCGTMAHPNNLHNQGCFKQVADFFARNLLVVSLCAIVVMLLEILALVAAIVLLNRVRKQIVWQWY